MPERWFTLDLDSTAWSHVDADTGAHHAESRFVWVERLDADCCGCCGCLQRCFRCNRRRGRARRGGGGCGGLGGWAGLLCALLAMVALALLAVSVDGLNASESVDQAAASNASASVVGWGLRAGGFEGVSAELASGEDASGGSGPWA